MLRNERGEASYHETADLNASMGAGVGALAGAVLGLVGGPAGIFLSGAAVAHFADRGLPDAELRQIAEALEPDTSAVLLLMDDVDTPKAIDSAEGLHARVLPFPLGDEASADVAMAIAGDLNFDGE